jgi:hypothetical protein
MPSHEIHGRMKKYGHSTRYLDAPRDPGKVIL